MQREMIELLQDKNSVDELLQEDYNIGTKRKNLIFRLSRLKEAQRHLLFFSL